MDEWTALKSAILAAAGLDRDAVQVYVALALLFGVAFAFRLRLSSPIPWLAVMAVALANKGAAIYADGLIERWEITLGLRDLANIMLAPTILFLASRFMPQLFAAPTKPILFMPDAVRLPAPRQEEVLEAEFEICEDLRVAAAPPRRRAAPAKRAAG
jgi:hypothetical protein